MQSWSTMFCQPNMFKVDLRTQWNKKHLRTCAPWNLFLEPPRSWKCTKCQDTSGTQRIWGVNAKAARIRNLHNSKRSQGFPHCPFGKNWEVAPSIAPRALFASDAFRIALRMIFIAISYLKLAIQKCFATCISAPKETLPIGRKFSSCDLL